MFDTNLTPQDLARQARELGKHPISYSQLSIYNNCPWSWKLRYIDKIFSDFGNIYTLFGSAIHTVIQEYITKLFTDSPKAANAIDLHARLSEEMKDEYITLRSQSKHPDTITNKEEMMKFYLEGCDILDYLQLHRNEYFDRKNDKLLGVELPLLVETDSHNNIMFNGFIDLAFATPSTGRIKIVDIKTSTKGWHDYKKKDFNTVAQLLLYKKYYAKRYNVDINMIDIEYFIVKRQLLTDCEYAQKRIQRFVPANGTPSINKAEKLITEFVKNFDENGKVMLDRHYVKCGGRSCTFCEYKEDELKLCPKNERMV